MNNNKYEIVKFKDDDFELDVNISSNENTIWLNLEQICILFQRDIRLINRCINTNNHIYVAIS